QNTDNMEAFVKGVRIVYEQLLTIMKSHGVEQIDALGQNFNPAMHEAMMQKTEAEQEDGVVLEEFQKGYRLNERIIRPAKVVVNTRPAEQEEDTE
ncbi:MAG: nucleotide exchange factor GrpE, partial [Planctomycetes bacterium]|nr:nucleotide exchange factor GrpE [Planctomycetota bacterium]